MKKDYSSKFTTYKLKKNKNCYRIQRKNEKKKNGTVHSISSCENKIYHKLRYNISIREKKDCAICLENLYSENNLKKPVILKCEHKFHPNCLYQWFHKNSTCPLCRIKCNIISISKKDSLNIEIEKFRKQAIQGDGTSRYRYFFLKNKKEISQLESEYFLNILVDYIDNNRCSKIPNEILSYINENDINLK